MKARAALAVSVLLASCGARTDLGGRRAGGTSACAPLPPATTSCTKWIAGTPQIVAPKPADHSTMTVGAAVAVRCGVLVAWSRVDGFTQLTSWTTRLVAFDGAPLAAPVPQPKLVVAQNSATALSVVVAGDQVGVLEVDADGCKFLTLDGSGHAIGDVSDLGTGYCFGLSARPGGWSFVRASGAGGAEPPFALVSLDAAGHATDTTLAAATQQLAWDRLTFDDGSFLLDTFWEDTVTAQYSDWLAPYDATGASLRPRVQVKGFDSAPVWLAPAAAGALSAWTWDALWVQPVDRTGAPTGPAQNVSGAATIYETGLVQGPHGDVLLAWKALEGSQFTLYAAATAPDGTRRGPITQLALDQDESRIFGTTDTNGTRAVLVSTERSGIQILPLSCE